MKFLLPVFFALFFIQLNAQQFNEEELKKKLNSLPTNEQIKLFDSLSNSYNLQSTDQGIAQLNFMIRYAKKNNFPEKEIADLLYSRGGIYRKLSQFSNALNDYRFAEKIYSKKNNPVGLSSVYTAYANLYQSIGDNVKAINHLHQAIKINSRYSYKDGMGVAYNGLANIYLDLKNYDSALYYYKKSYLIYKEEDAGYQRSLLLDNISMVHMKNRSVDSAYVYSKLARQEAKKVNDIYLDLQLMLNACGIEEALGHDQLNLEISERAKKIADSLKIPVYQLYTTANYANALFKTGNINQAVKQYIQVIPRIKAANLNDLLVEVYQSYSEVFEEIGKTDSAFHYYKLAAALNDTIEKQTADEKVTELIARNQLENKENRLQHEQELRKTEQEAFQLEKQVLEKQKNMQWWIIALSVLAIIVTITLLIIINKRLNENRQLTALLKDKNNEILEKNKSLFDSKQEIISSINYAKRIQFALLAHDELLKNNLPQYFVWFQPKDIVSGDFYWATEIVKNGKKEFYLAVCDSTGHGVPGAFMSLLNISFLNEAINEKKISAPNEILNHVRTRLIENMEGAKDGMDATLLKFSENRIEYASAHNRPVLIRNGVLKELEADKMPVGMDYKMESFTNYKLETETGDKLFLFTDGYADQFGGPRNKKFKYAQFHQLLQRISLQKTNEMKNELQSAFESWKGKNEQIDDVCVIGITI